MLLEGQTSTYFVSGGTLNLTSVNQGGRCLLVCVFLRCNVVSQFNDGLYDIVIAADERSLDNPKTAGAEASTNRHKLVL